MAVEVSVDCSVVISSKQNAMQCKWIEGSLLSMAVEVSVDCSVVISSKQNAMQCKWIVGSLLSMAVEVWIVQLSISSK